MIKSINLWVPGTPATAGSKKPFTFRDKKTGKIRALMAPDSKRQKPWMAKVSVVAMENYKAAPLRGYITLRVDFCFARPKSHYGSGKNHDQVKPSAPRYHTQKPDLDKLLRAAMDAMTGIVWHDDCQIVRYEDVRKFWVTGRPGAAIWIEWEEKDHGNKL